MRAWTLHWVWNKSQKNRWALLNARLCDGVWFRPAPPIQRFCHAGTLRDRTMSGRRRGAAAGPSGVAPLLSWGPAWHFYSTPRATGHGGKRCDSALAPPVPDTSAYCARSGWFSKRSDFDFGTGKTAPFRMRYLLGEFGVLFEVFLLRRNERPQTGFHLEGEAQSAWFVLISAPLLSASVIIALERRCEKNNNRDNIQRWRRAGAHLRCWRWRRPPERWALLLALSAPCFSRRRPSVRCCGSVWGRRDSLLSGKAPADPPARLTPDLPAAASNSQPRVPPLPPARLWQVPAHYQHPSVITASAGHGEAQLCAPLRIYLLQNRFLKAFYATCVWERWKHSLRSVKGWTLFPENPRCGLDPRRTRWLPERRERLSRCCEDNKNFIRRQ